MCRPISITGAEDRATRRRRIPETNSAPPDPSLPARLRAFHAKLPLAGGRPNALLPDDRVLYLAAVLRNTPQQPPPLSSEEWRELLGLLRPHGVYALLA